MSDVGSAHKAVLAAEAKITEAERNRDEAYDQLDQALAAAGWIRMVGGFSGRLYQFRGGEPQPIDAVLRYEMGAAA
jgi:hypothetical protein